MKARRVHTPPRQFLKLVLPFASGSFFFLLAVTLIEMSPPSIRQIIARNWTMRRCRANSEYDLHRFRSASEHGFLPILPAHTLRAESLGFLRCRLVSIDHQEHVKVGTADTINHKACIPNRPNCFPVYI